MKTGILILSSPRSGSSCFTACLQLCGVHLGENLATVKDNFNEKGYFENKDILNFNEKVLGTTGANVFEPYKIFGDLGFTSELVNILKTNYKEPVFAIKDTRINILSDLYLAAFDQLKLKTKIIWLSRNSEHVAKSLNRMFNIPLERGKSISGEYNSLAGEIVKKIDHEKISFEQFLTDPITDLKRICSFLSLPQENINQDEILKFIDNKLVHFSD